jgi:ribosomal protein L23
MTEPSLTPPKPALPTVLESPVFQGPVKTERFGQVLGVDLGCADSGMVVSRDVRMPRASYVITTAARHVIRLSKSGEKIDGILVWGSEADPTMHPEFREITGNLRDLRNKWFAKAKLHIVSENPRVEAPEVRHALGIYDQAIVRFDWGTAKTYAALTERKCTEYANLCAHLGHLENLVFQVRFFRGEVDNSTEAEVKAWIKKISELKPRGIQILNPEGKGKKTKPLTKSRITEIAAEIAEKVGITPQIFTAETVLS